jgi:hypothetical protein
MLPEDYTIKFNVIPNRAVLAYDTHGYLTIIPNFCSTGNNTVHNFASTAIKKLNFQLKKYEKSLPNFNS